MTTEQVLGVLGFAVVVLVVPGLVVGVAAGLRGWVLAGTAPVLTAGVIGVAGPTLPLIGIAWSPTSFLIATLVLAVLVAVLGRALRRAGPSLRDAAVPADPHRWNIGHHVGVAAGVIAATVVGLVVSLNASRALTGIPQWHDATHHASAVRLIADTGDSAPGALAAVVALNGQDYFYPNGYYILCATVRQLGAVGVVPTLDMVNALLVGVFALGLVALLVVLRAGPAMCAAAAVVACAVPMFPYEVLVWGPLFPFTAGVALLPAGVALVVRVWNRWIPVSLPVAAVATVGLAVVHVSSAVGAVVLVGFFLVQRWVTGPRRVPGDLRALVVVVMLGLVFGGPYLLDLLQSRAVEGTAGIVWPEEGTASRAFGQFATATRNMSDPQWWLAVMLAVGILALPRRRFRAMYWWVLAGIGFVGIYVLTAASSSELQKLLSDPWSDDPYRLAAVAVPATVVVAAAGIVTVRDVLTAAIRVPLRLRRGEWALRAGALGAVVTVVVLVSGGLAADRNTRDLARLYPDGPIVSTAKKRAMEWVALRIPPGTLVANNSLDGSPWMWALYGVEPMLLSASAGWPRDGSDRSVVILGLNRLDDDQRVRDAVRNLRISYVFISQGSVAPGVGEAPGLRGLDLVRGLELVRDEDGIQIYAVRGVTAPASAVDVEQP